MVSWSSIDAQRWSGILDQLRAPVGAARSLEGAAQLVCSRLAETVGETALVRIYAILPYKDTPLDVRTFVDELASRAGQHAGIPPLTRVLSLLGTHGSEEAWGDRRQSKGHQGIPLVSAAFVDAIPMLARLLRELGLDLTWLDDAPEIVTRRLLGGFNGVFYVEDAATARDAKGRLIIPAADFVAAEKVKSVFGMGGSYPDGTVLACIVFTRERLPRAIVERFTSLITMLKGETFAAVLARRFFTPVL